MTRKIAMTTIRTVLTMLNCGFSYSKIRHHTGASNGFINKLASAARSDLEAFLKLSDEEIYERVYPKTQNSHCEPNWEVVNDLLQKKHMTLQLVYDEYCRMHAGQRIYSYSSFCRRYADKKPNWEPQDLFTNLHYVTVRQTPKTERLFSQVGTVVPGSTLWLRLQRNAGFNYVGVA